MVVMNLLGNSRGVDENIYHVLAGIASDPVVLNLPLLLTFETKTAEKPKKAQDNHWGGGGSANHPAY